MNNNLEEKIDILIEQNRNLMKRVSALEDMNNEKNKAISSEANPATSQGNKAIITQENLSEEERRKQLLQERVARMKEGKSAKKKGLPVTTQSDSSSAFREEKIGKYFMGIIATTLILIGLVVLGSMTWNLVSDGLKTAILLILGGLLSGISFGLITANKLPDYRVFFISLLGCGLSILYTTCILMGNVWMLIPEVLTFALIFSVLTITAFLTYFLKSNILYVLNVIGIIVSMLLIFGRGVDATYSGIASICIIIFLAKLIFIAYREEWVHSGVYTGTLFSTLFMYLLLMDKGIDYNYYYAYADLFSYISEPIVVQEMVYPLILLRVILIGFFVLSPLLISRCYFFDSIENKENSVLYGVGVGAIATITTYILEVGAFNLGIGVAILLGILGAYLVGKRNDMVLIGMILPIHYLISVFIDYQNLDSLYSFYICCVLAVSTLALAMYRKNLASRILMYWFGNAMLLSSMIIPYTQPYLYLIPTFILIVYYLLLRMKSIPTHQTEWIEQVVIELLILLFLSKGLEMYITEDTILISLDIMLYLSMQFSKKNYGIVSEGARGIIIGILCALLIGSIYNETFLALLLANISCITISLNTTYRIAKRNRDVQSQELLLVNILDIVLIVGAFSTMNRVLGMGLGNILLSICILILATSIILYGFKREDRSLRMSGLILSMMSVLKMVLFDISSSDSMIRVLALISGGIICFGISYVYNRFDKK